MEKIGPDKNYVFSILSYDRESGWFLWKESRGSTRAGRRAGSCSLSNGKPYRRIKIDKVLYSEHHLAWLFEYGEWPPFDLDHIDGDGENNKISNLRPCTMSQNKGNSKKYKNNKSGHKGVFWRKDIQRWTVSIQCERRRIYLGRFVKYEDAVAAYNSAAEKYFADFARAA